MRRLKLFFTLILSVFLILASVYHPVSAYAEENDYYLGGMAAGFMMGVGGVQIIGINEVATEEGIISPAQNAGLKPGDKIVAINGIKTGDIATLNRFVGNSKGNELLVKIERGNEWVEMPVLPAKEKKSGQYKIGVLVRDSVSGIGTITYIEKDTHRFGALGHAASENCVVGKDFQVYLCSVIGVNKGTRGKAGELRGLFMNDNRIATADRATGEGLFGQFCDNFDYSKLKLVKGCGAENVKIGKAEIYSTINGVEPQKFEAAIVKVDENNKENKNYVLKITDERLISETGGIVQGMSGSPILQDGKLIGAVTHVFINDPTRGFGISLDKMRGN